MKKIQGGIITAMFLVSLLAISSATATVVWSKNLLTNPGAETGDMSGWMILSNGGSGWTVGGGAYEGSYTFRTSYEWCTRYQEVDLLAKGYTGAQLDASPIVKVEEWFGEIWDSDLYYLLVELRDKDHNVITSWYSGVLATGGSPGYGDDGWYQLAHIFSDYGPGLRYIYWEDGGKDTEWWNHWYGAKLDAAFLSLETEIFSNAVPAFWPVAHYRLRQVNTCLECIEEDLPEDVPEDIQNLLDEMQVHIDNANTTGNSIYANNELLKALKCCEDIQEILGITCL